MVTQPISVQERRCLLQGALGALDGLGSVLHQACGGELAELMTLVDAVAAGAAAARVLVTVEAITRGEVEQSGDSAHVWVCDHAPSLRQGGAGDVATVAQAVTPAASRWRAQGSEVDPESPLGIVWAAVSAGSASPWLATAVMREMQRLGPLLVDEATPTVTRMLLQLGLQWGPAVMRRLRPRMLAEYGVRGVLDDLQERLAPAARLSTAFVESADLTHYQLLMTPEQATALEAAIGPLCAPAPNDQTWERDLRPAGQRRVEALTEVCRRSSGIDADTKGGEGAAGSACAVHVIIALADLQAATGSGEVVGSTATGTLLSPQVLRRISCEADLIPHVLGTAGEDLDLGRVVRLFTRAQRRRLWRRDRCCTYPGCTAPAAWSRAHHVLHWVDGGLSDVDNAALLCQRHHTVVHKRRLWAQVRPTPDEQSRYVIWDLHVGSYDRQLAELERERSANDSPPLTQARLLELAAALTSDDPDEQRWAHHELSSSLTEEQCNDEPWHDEQRHDQASPDEAHLDEAYRDQLWAAQDRAPLERSA